MKIRSVVMATLMLSGSLVFAQVCPPTSSGTVCLVPSRSYGPGQSTAPGSYPTAACPTTACPPAYQAACPTPCPTGYSSAVTVPYTPQVAAAAPAVAPNICASLPLGLPANIQTCSPDTLSILNELEALRVEARATRAEIKTASLQFRGLDIISRMNRLMGEEMAFRQAFSANPNLPNARMLAMGLQDQATTLNQMITGFNQELSMIPPDQRAFLACNLNTFDTVYWSPAMMRFAAYNNTFTQTACAIYQPLFAANPWLQQWTNGFQSSLTTIASAPQTYASARWWVVAGTPQGLQVMGTTEAYQPGSQIVGSVMMLPNGNTVFVPSSNVPIASASSCNVCATPTTPTVAGTVEVTPPTPMPMPTPAPATPPTTRGEARGAY